MQDLRLLEDIGTMVVAALVMMLFFRKFSVPSIIVYIITGLVLGPILGVVTVTAGEGDELHDATAHTLEIISEVGIVLLLFLVGLELSLDKIKDLGRVAFLAGIGQVVFTAAGGFVFALLLGFEWLPALIIATALTFSSTVVVVKLLDQKKQLHSLFGRIAVGIFLVQDLVVVIIMTLLTGLGTEETMEPLRVAMSLLVAFGGTVFLLLAALLASRYVLPRTFGWASRSPETVFIWSLCWCFLFVVAAEWLNLSAEIGAFLAGLSIAQLSCAPDLRRRVHPLMNFFIAIFFISLGAQMQLGEASEYWFAAVILSLFVLIGNPFIFMIIIARCGYSERTSFMTSVTVAQISEFSFIFAAMGLAYGLIDSSVLSLIMLIGLITIGCSAYMILYAERLYDWCRGLGLLKMFRAKQEDDEDAHAEQLSGHVIVVGMNALGRSVVEELHRRGETVLAVDTDPHKLQCLPARKMVGNMDYLQVVEETGFARAKLVMSALQIEDTNNLLAWRCQQFGVPCAIHAFDRSVFTDLKRLGVSYLVEAKFRSMKRVENDLREDGVIA